MELIKLAMNVPMLAPLKCLYYNNIIALDIIAPDIIIQFVLNSCNFLDRFVRIP